MLERQLIRAQTVAQLSGRTRAGDRVYPTMILPWRRELPLPALGVYTLEEPGEAINGGGTAGPFMIRSTLRLVVEAVTRTPAPADLEPAARLMIDSAAELDALYEEVCTALLPNPDWYAPFDPAMRRRVPLFEAVERWDWSGALARVEDTDQRTTAGSLTATIRYTCEYAHVCPEDFCRVQLDVDVIDPAADPNVKYPGPDGRIEVALRVPRPGIDPPLCPEGPEDPSPPQRREH
jgi:hypothetical protein